VKVLIVEDDLAISESTGEVLRIEGIASEHVPTIDGATAFLEAEPFDVVLLDLYLPGGSGLDFLRRLRADPRHARQPVLLMTGAAWDALDEARQVLSESRPAELIVKPWEVSDLLAALRRLASQRVGG
jgi:DNA-binding response OmpR family regulator